MQHIEKTGEYVTIVASVTCDGCARTFRTSEGQRLDRQTLSRPGNESNDFEEQEFLKIDYRAGYGSVFEDGARIKADLCQHCVKDLLGHVLSVKSADDTLDRD